MAMPPGVDKTARLEINGSSQRVRVCASRSGLAPILVVQAGPGLPLLNEVRKIQRKLRLELDFLVAYWDQCGCGGNASRHDATSVSLHLQVDDLCAVLRWLRNETKQPVILFGISLGGAIALQAAEREPQAVRSAVVISP